MRAMDVKALIDPCFTLIPGWLIEVFNMDKVEKIAQFSGKKIYIWIVLEGIKVRNAKKIVSPDEYVNDL
jgi:hypothetical protein